MMRYFAGRLGLAVPTLLALTFAAFFLTTAARGDPALLALQQAGVDPTPEALVEYREKLGLNDPMPVRYVHWLQSVVMGKLGTSFLSNRPVVEVLGERVVPTVALGLVALTVSTIAGIGLGIRLALVRSPFVDGIVRGGAILGGSIPGFWLAIGLIVVFGEWLRLFPVAGYGHWEHFVLPVTALTLGSTVSLMRLTRAIVLDVLSEDYVRTAIAKGLPARTVLLSHVLRNAFLPLLALTGLRFGHILAGAVIIESIFAWPGMGTVVIGAISGRDLPIIGGYVLIAGSLMIAVNLGVDLVSGMVDPRVQYGHRPWRGG